MKKNQNPKKAKQRERAHAWAFPLGLAIVILALVGTVTLIVFGVNSVKKLTDNTAKKLEYETFLAEVVRNDPDPYDDISKADMSDLLDSAIWRLVKSEDFLNKGYPFSTKEPIGLIVPSSDILEHFKTLFGEEFPPVYSTVEGPGYTFTYLPEKDCFVIQVTAVDPIYTPKVTKIEKKGGSLTLYVSYLKFADFPWDNTGNPVEPTADKFVKITLRETKREPGYYVSAIQASSEQETADGDKRKPTTAAPTTQEDFTTPELSDEASETEGSTTEETTKAES
ncbi:MAG: hypothetical protein ACOYJX_01320 [Acutalibacteraceae bacterium]|jgi:hypothetical protein